MGVGGAISSHTPPPHVGNDNFFQLNHHGLPDSGAVRMGGTRPPVLMTLMVNTRGGVPNF